MLSGDLKSFDNSIWIFFCSSVDNLLEEINFAFSSHLLSENICNYYNDKTETDCINVRLSNSYGSPIFKENNCWWLVINDLCKTAIEKNRNSYEKVLEKTTQSIEKFIEDTSSELEEKIQ